MKAETTAVQFVVSNAIEESAPLVDKIRVSAWRKSISRDDILARKLELQAYDALITRDFQSALNFFVAAENASNGFNCVYEWGKLLRDRQKQFGSKEGQKSIIRDAPEKVCTTYVPQELREKLKAISQ